MYIYRAYIYNAYYYESINKEPILLLKTNEIYVYKITCTSIFRA